MLRQKGVNFAQFPYNLPAFETSLRAVETTSNAYLRAAANLH